METKVPLAFVFRSDRPKLSRLQYLVGRQCSHPVRRTVILVTSSVLLLILRVIVYMVRVPKMRHGGFFVFSRPTGLLQLSDNVR